MEPSAATPKPRLGLLRVSPDGPYFDLEFAFEEKEADNSSSSSRSSSRRMSSSSDDLFFIKRVNSPHSSSKPLAAKLRYFMLRFKNHIKSPSRHRKVEPEEEEAAAAAVAAEEEEQEQIRSGVEVIHKYLSKIKPLYVRVSKRYADKLRFSGQLGTPAADHSKSSSSSSSPVANFRRRLRKCRSASAAVAAVPPPPPLVQQHEEDGIESAIAHCKRSFSSDKGSDLGLVRSKSDPGGGRADQPK